ncbi:hypothetical protein SYNPS1DRAFT_23124 [Syncephalis pseudoplumigaleata]|uniref:F-box domain-containing protein n=1 Tax=Syncephalis pseudoplumigaleata TaxID=1712513 RepID=A0A4P9YY11_9FUNG|nr:hypothetical protein SYNPS1DRAFT_23124 [Syncephalis pseudoplumigaleata]|eukprot:RKP24828.1 hypothetical protein SYNPS1DRAFT_23124 [Syncephalis pseudoplumigaleata]
MFCRTLGRLVQARCRKQYARLKRICRRKKGKSSHGRSQLLSERRRGTEWSTLSNCQFCVEAISGVFPSLPKELILHISSWLDPVSALALSRASRKFHEILVNDNMAWRQRYKLAYPPTTYRERELLDKLQRDKRPSLLSRLGLDAADGGWLVTMAQRALTERRWRNDAGTIRVTSLQQQPLTSSAGRKRGEKRLADQHRDEPCTETAQSKRLFRGSQKGGSSGSSRHSSKHSTESLFPSSLWLHAAVEFTVTLYNGRLYVRNQRTRAWRRLVPVLPAAKVSGNPFVTGRESNLVELEHIALEGVKVHGRYVRGLGCLASGDYWDFFWDALSARAPATGDGGTGIAYQHSFAAFREGAMEIVGDKLLLQDFDATSLLRVYDLQRLAAGDASDPCTPQSTSASWLQGDHAPLASYTASESAPGYLLAVKLHAAAAVLRCFSLDLNHWADAQHFMLTVDLPMHHSGPCSWIELAPGGFDKERAVVHGQRSGVAGEHGFLMGLHPTLGRCHWYTELAQLEVAAVRVSLDYRRVVLLSSASQLAIHDLDTGQPLHRLSLQVPSGPRLDRLDHILGPLLLVSDHAVSSEDPFGQTIVLVDVAQGRALWRRRIERTEATDERDTATATRQHAPFPGANPSAIPPRLTVCATHMLVATLSRRTIIELVYFNQ